MRAMKVKNGKVENVAIFPDNQSIPSGWVVAPDKVGVKWKLKNGEFVPPDALPESQEDKDILAKASFLKNERYALFDILIDVASGSPLPEGFADRVANYKSAKD